MAFAHATLSMPGRGTTFAEVLPPHIIAPSWSWASVKDIIQMPLIYDRGCYDNNKMKAPLEIHCKVNDVGIELTDARYETGQGSSSQLNLQACLIGPVHWEDNFSDCLKVVMRYVGETDFEVGFERERRIQLRRDKSR